MPGPRLQSCAAFAAVTTLLLLPLGAQAQQRAMVNSSFESNDPQGAGTPNWQTFTNGQVSGWDATTGEIELWDSNFSGVPSYNGLVHAEMNANDGGALYQTICLVNGESVGWTFAHRARSGGAATQTARFQIASTSGTLIQNLATQASTINNVWNVNSGSTTYSGPSGMQRVQFTTSDAGSYGNFLDDIRINLNPFVEFNGASATGVESVPSANVPALIVSGTLFTPRTVSVTVTGGTATRGTDYTTPGGGATFTVTIPAGVYQNVAVPLGITITDDSAIENSETILLSISSGTGYTISGTQACGGTPVSSASYTITDNDSPVVLAKTWVNGIAGDAVSLTISGGTGATAGSSTVGGSATNATSTASWLQTITLTEAFTTGNAANYATTLECRRNDNNNVVATSGSGLSRTFTMPFGATVTCIYTNTRRSASLVVRKTWTSAKLADAATVATTGLQNNASLPTVANAINETDSAAAVTVYAAESGTFSEVFSVGDANNYTATLACTGNATALAGSVLTINPADTAIVCTYTNVRKSASLRLRKTWVNATVGNAVTLPATTGFTNNTVSFASTANSANETDTGVAVTVYAGDSGTIRAETFTSGTPGSYASALACSGGSLSGTNAKADNTLTVMSADAGATILCTYTNTRFAPLTVAKTSTLLGDGINATNPKAIPGATMRYCVLVTNPGPSSATTVIAMDTLPAGMTFVAGSMRSGTACASATTVEDDNSTGADETDPFGLAATGSNISGQAASLASGATFAMVFEATVN